MRMHLPDYLPVQGKRLENLKIILSHMDIGERHHYFAASMPYFVLKNEGPYYKFCDEGTYLLITDEHKEHIAFAHPDLEDSFLEVGDDRMAKNIFKQIKWAIKDINRYTLRDDIYLKACYIEAPEINVSCVGMFNEVSKGPEFYVDSSSKVRSRTRPARHMIAMLEIKIENLTDKGLSENGVPPN